MRIYALLFPFLIAASSTAFSQELSFSEFAELKSRVVEAGEAIGRARACEAANPGQNYGAESYLEKYRGYMSETTLSFEILEKLDAEMLNASNLEEASTAWISEYQDLIRVSDCNDVCCVVGRDSKVLEDRGYYHFKDYYRKE